ncbi:unnamed protein product [Arctia plantaginis]|uniref:Uncharacterized protein n=1 Tax=Arctia plantaginis TaxID=874455 RepID=A0A8S1B1H8_ARCPL|nr:unnamed protein product [Arctia plantaginis]
MTKPVPAIGTDGVGEEVAVNGFVLLYGFCHDSADRGVSEQYLFDFTKNDEVDAWQEQSDTVRDVGMSQSSIGYSQKIWAFEEQYFSPS